MPHLDPPKKVPVPPEGHAPHATVKNPGPSDLHEQRQPNQEQEVVEKTPSRPPTQSVIDAERGDWEGMGQGSPRPD